MRVANEETPAGAPLWAGIQALLLVEPWDHDDSGVLRLYAMARATDGLYRTQTSASPRIGPRNIDLGSPGVIH
jgi:hypothetical protein